MNKRRFFVFTVFLFLLFVFAFGSGCGGGGVSDLGNNDGNNQGNQDNTNNDSPASPVSSLVEYAASHISIGYQNGDNSGYVTKNLTLPTNVDNVENVTITWTSSNPSAISTSGNVNRQTSDTQVTMTANVSDGSETKERTFALKVIRARSRSVEQAKSEIRINGVDEIRLMNVSNDDFQITYSASRDRVTDIDGKYSDIVVTNADDALDSIQSVRGILGLNDPYTELENDVVTSDTYGGEYTFSQVHNGVKVFGRNITASANSAGETDFVASSVVPSATLTNSDLNFSYTQDQAETTAKGHYSGSFDIRSDKTEKIIFTLESYDNNPAPAYIVNVYGTDNEGKYVDENLFVNARNGEVIYSSSNIHDYSVTAEDELDETVTFNLEETLQSDGSTVYVMHDPETRVWIYNNDYGLSNLVSKPAGSTWNDKQQISTYLNMIKIIKWWKNTLNRDSLDGNSMDVDVITHERVYNYRDNAYWWGWTKKIYICDPRSNSRSYAVAPEVINHEATHAVMMYRVGSDFSNNYNNAPGAINEGYADIFGCLQANHWLIGLHVFANNAYTRNISDPADPNSRQNINTRITAPTTLSERYTGTQDNGGVHINSSLISYPAYKMRSFGMSWEDLAKVWYKSMRMGYSASSNYHTVRRCVLRAAKKLQMSNENVEIIKKAFDEVGITSTTCTLKGKVSVYGGSALPRIGVQITPVIDRSTHGSSIMTDSEGNYLRMLSAGDYNIEVNQSGYVPFKALKTVEEGENNVLNISLVAPSASTPSQLNGLVRDALTGNVIEGASFKIRSGWNIHEGTTTAECLSESDGSYTTPLLAGYYTIEVSKEGYSTTIINDFVIPANSTFRRDIILSPEDDGKYRVTLQWDANPRDLDSHLIGPITNGSGNFHVYFLNKSASDSQGNVIARLDHDDTQGYGFETITFEMKPGEKFKYYVHWYAGDGTWGGSNAVVNLYKSSQLIATFPVPDVDLHGNSSGRYWHVFDLTSGMDPVQPATSASIVQTEPTIN